MRGAREEALGGTALSTTALVVIESQQLAIHAPLPPPPVPAKCGRGRGQPRIRVCTLTHTEGAEAPHFTSRGTCVFAYV